MMEKYKNTPKIQFDIDKLYKTRAVGQGDDNYLIVKCLAITPAYCLFQIIKTYGKPTLYPGVDVGRKYHTCAEGRRANFPHIFDIAEEIIIN